jgi:hypothetical protein
MMEGYETDSYPGDMEYQIIVAKFGDYSGRVGDNLIFVKFGENQEHGGLV